MEIKVKGSRFIGTVAPVHNREAAEAFLTNVRREFHDATHNCFAYRINSDHFRYSDDGEPSGSAGRPILSVLDRHQLKQVILVVTRYFGGTKLGTGGLMRAYGQCAEDTVQAAQIIKKPNYREITVEYPFDLINKVQHLSHKYRARIREDASEQGMQAHIHILPSRLENFKEELITATSGKIKLS